VAESRERVGRWPSPSSLRAAERARTPRGSEKPLKESRLPPEGTARSQDRRGPRRGGPPDRRVAGLPGLEEAPSPHGDGSGDLPSVPSKVHEDSLISDATIRAKSVCHGPTAVVPPLLDPRPQGQHRPRPRLVDRGARRGTCLVYRRPYSHLPTVRPTRRRRPRPADDQTLD
jgi:hypothetical protein